MEDFNNKNWEDRIEDIKKNLYIGGGIGQANALLSIMMSPFGSKEFGHPDIDLSQILNNISQQIKDLTRVVKDGGIVPINIFESNFKSVHRLHDAYACLDKNLKFCVKHYGEEDWKDILYVFPYMNCTTAYDVAFKYDHIHQSDLNI